MFDLLTKLKEKFTDIRGDYSESVKIEMEDLHRRIIESTEMKDLANSKAGKKLITSVTDYIERIDSTTMDEQVKSDIKLELLKQRKAWINVLRTLLGGKSQLKAIETQIKTYLQTDD